jgi:hypothetical protein
MRANFRIYTFKAGVLARLAHDLQLSADVFELILQAGRVSASVDVASLRVDGVISPRGLEPNALSEHDKRQITATIRKEILDVAHFERVEFAGELELTSSRVPGSLRLRGQERPLTFELEVQADRVFARAELAPSQFGIEPYKALAGAIKLQDRVRLEAELLLAGQSAAELSRSAEPLRFGPLT